jgi:hypothetical protein
MIREDGRPASPGMVRGGAAEPFGDRWVALARPIRSLPVSRPGCSAVFMVVGTSPGLSEASPERGVAV